MGAYNVLRSAQGYARDLNMSMNVEAEIRDLKRRVSELEGSFGFLTQQVKTLHKDVLAFEAKTEEKLKEHDKRFDKVDGRLDKIDGRLDHLDRGLRGLRTDMPKIVGDAMREAQADKPRRKS
jgi:predicted RNase H-like nuclease (RuvC/YqgF family)